MNDIGPTAGLDVPIIILAGGPGSRIREETIVLARGARTRCGSSRRAISGARHRTGARFGVETHSPDQLAR